MIVSASGRRRGITLLEVLVSMSIFLLAFAAITQLMDTASRNALDANFQTDATRLAQSKLAEVEAGAITPDGTTSGTFDIEPGWEWTMEPTPTDVANVYLVSVTVSRQIGGSSLSFTLSQMIFDSRLMGNSSEVVKPTTTGSTTP